MSEWLELMLGEIERREQEQCEARKERERRGDAARRDADPAEDQE